MEVLEEAGTKAQPPQRSQQPKGTSVEGGRPRWRPCQLNSQEVQGNDHHHHPHLQQQSHHHQQQHHHYHQQSHHHQQQLGTGRAPPRRSKRHTPGHSQRKVSDSREGQSRPGPPPRPGPARYRRSGERSYQHRDRQQAKVGYGNIKLQQAHDVQETDRPSDTVSHEKSSHELLTPPLHEELTPSPNEVTEKDGGSPGLHCSSSTESSLHAHSEQTENLHTEKEEVEEGQACRDEREVDGSQKEEEEEQACHVESAAGLKCSVHAHSRRAGPIRVDVPPCAASPPHSRPVDHIHPRSFSGPLRGYSSEPKPCPAHFSSTGYAPVTTGQRPEFRSCTQSCEEPLSDVSPEAASESCLQPSSSSFPKPFRPTPAESHGEVHRAPLVGHNPERSEEQRSTEKVLSTSPSSRPMPQPGWQDQHRQQASIGSRLHCYDQQSGDEASCPERNSTRCEMRTSSSDCVDREPGEPRKACLDTSPGSDGGEALECGRLEAQTPALTLGLARPAGDAISLAIRDIKEAIEEVKTKALHSPYTPEPPAEPVWVMRRDMSPTEERPLQDVPHTPPQDSAPNCTTPSPDASVPLRAEPSRTQEVHKEVVTLGLSPAEELRRNLAAFPTYVDGPCDPEDLIDGIIFAASYLGSTQLLSERMPSKSGRMRQAQEAMSRVRAAQKKAQTRHKQVPDGEGPSSAYEVDLFLSIQRIKVLNADTQVIVSIAAHQETVMDHPLRTISYIADIGNTVVLMARGKIVRSHSVQEQLGLVDSHLPSPTMDPHPQYRMVCHVFESEDAQLIAQSIGQAFSVAYQEFLRANGIDPDDLSQREYSDLLSTQDMYNDDLIHFSRSENCRDVHIEKQKGEILGMVIVESGWGSILPTVIIASLMHSGPAAKSGRLNIGDQIMTVNGTSLVGLPLSTCQSIIKGLKSQSRIKMNIVRCPPVTMVLVRRPELRYQLGFSVQNGIICSLMRGGIAERGGVRVGHRIIEINGQSVVATPHEKIVHILSNAIGEIHMKTMPAAVYRLLTAQEQPVYI
ncbi:amyloid-beta A4 precursor protein-binding family A member 1 isoform X3 [Brachyhypopomus gauderio]|uniref:amyloid-beta A4 precursor protein-binding family A member 1 isoform X3 n=1 Tax=Brachyhypopomus gauderio TaxID=698409 RepID=UPI004040F50A